MIFENGYVETLCLRYKRNQDFATYFRICDHLTNLLHSIIRRSRYHRTVPFRDLMASLYTQVGRWVMKWVPGQGMFYTYAATSAKNGCMSMIAKEAIYRSRYVEMGDVPVDAFGHMTVRYDMLDQGGLLADRIAEIEVRWNDPRVREAIRVCLKSILRHRGEVRERDGEGKSHDYRKYLLRTMTLGYEFSSEEAKFLVDWSLSSVRQAILDQFSSPIGPSDIIRLQARFSFLPDLINIVGVEKTQQLMHVFAGMAIRFPTMSQLKKTAHTVAEVNRVIVDNLPDRDLSEDIEMQMLDAANLISDGILEDRSLFDEEDYQSFVRE